MTDKELLQEALDALEAALSDDQPYISRSKEAIEALRARLAQPDVTETNFGKMPETINMENFVGSGKPLVPVAWKMKGVPAFATSRPNDTDSIKWDALYTAPPQREWVGLTDEELLDIADMAYANDLELLQNVQTKLKEKNT